MPLVSLSIALVSLDFRLIYFPPGRRWGRGVLVQSKDCHIEALHSLFDVMKLPVSLSCGCVDGNIDICIENKIFVITKLNFFFHKLLRY